MKVVVYASDEYACGHYRSTWPAEAARRAGMDVEVIKPGQRTGVSVFTVNGINRWQLPECDVIVLQRPARRMLADMVPRARECGIAVVVDMDDDLERIHPSNHAYRGMHPKYSEDYNWAHARRACRGATMVTASTPALLQRYASPGRGRLLRNCVPGRFLLFDRNPDGPIGWAGSEHSHPGDLDPAMGTLERLNREGHDISFVGEVERTAEKLGVPCTGRLEFDEWMPAVAGLGVGLAPLASSSFNDAKSWLKPLEYSAVGVPWVASDTPEYRELAKLCDAPVVTKPKEWYAAVKRLATSRAARDEAAGRAREAASRLTFEANAHLWAEAWEAAALAERRPALT